MHEPPDCRARETGAEALLDQLADQRQGPQREVEAILLGCVVSNGADQPRHLFTAELWWPSGNRLGLQDFMPAAAVRREPSIQRADIQSVSVGYLLDLLTVTHSLHGLNPHRLQ